MTQSINPQVVHPDPATPPPHPQTNPPPSHIDIPVIPVKAQQHRRTFPCAAAAVLLVEEVLYHLLVSPDLSGDEAFRSQGKGQLLLLQGHLVDLRDVRKLGSESLGVPIPTGEF